MYHLHMPIVMKTGSLNLLDSSGPVQACNGIALPLCSRGEVQLMVQTPVIHMLFGG